MSDKKVVKLHKNEIDDRENTRLSTKSEGSYHTPPLSSSSSTPPSRSRSKTVSTASANTETEQSTGLNLLQSIRDLTQQELNRANPLGLLGKEIISATGTTHCPEPIPPKESDEIPPKDLRTSSSSSLGHVRIHDNEPPQQLIFPLNEEEKAQMQRRRSTLANITDETLPPCPAEYLPNDTDQDFQPHLFSQPSATTMVADFIPDTMTINVFEVFIYAWGVFAFFFDTVTDLVLAHAYYVEGAFYLFILTLMCVILPNITLSVFSLVWYIDSSQLKVSPKVDSEPTYQTAYCQTEDSNENNHDHVDSHVSRMRDPPKPPEQIQSKTTFQLSRTTMRIFTWIIRIIVLVLQLDLCLKYIRGLYYTWKGFQKRHHPKWARFYLTKQILIDADIALLRVFDCFMDSGSQVILQLYIMLRLGSASMKFDTLFAKQCLSIISSLGSLAYALSGYSRCWRHMQLTHSPQGWPKDKPPPQLVSWWSTIIQWLWYLLLITPRVLALAMFAATFRSWFWTIIIAHWFAMLFWILRFRTIFCISDTTKYSPREAIFEKCYNLVCSYIFIFCYMNLRKGDTRLHYIGFYTIYYIENISFSIIYAIHSAETNSIFKYSLVTFVCLGFWFAILFQFLYYRFLHPSHHVRINTKQNLASLARLGSLPRFNRIKKSKSCEEIIDHNDQGENVSLQFNANSIDERWHNRFSKENRQILISQQKAIDKKVKLTRAQRQSEENHDQTPTGPGRIFNKISNSIKRPTTLSNDDTVEGNVEHQTPINSSNNRRQQFFNVKRVTLARSPHQESYAKMQQEDDDDFENHSIVYISDRSASVQSQRQSNPVAKHDDDGEMILTATKLLPTIIQTPSTPDIIINTSRC